MAKPIYIAHPLGAGADRPSNRQRAERWVCWAAENFNVAPIATWTTLAARWEEDKRDHGLAIDRVHVELVVRAGGQVWQVGGRVSPGMAAEAEWARALDPDSVVDLTALGEEPPTWEAVDQLAEIGGCCLRGGLPDSFEGWATNPWYRTAVDERSIALTRQGVAAFAALVRLGVRPA